MDNMQHYLTPALLVYIVIREIIYVYSTQKLVNKLMSRDYYSYKMSEQVGKVDQPKAPQHEDDEALAEDLSTLFG